MLHNDDKPTYGYRITRSRPRHSQDYNHLTIDIIRFTYKGQSIIDFTWQGNNQPSEWEEDGKQWYGFTIQPSHKLEGPEDLKEFYSLVKRFMDMRAYNWTDLQPADLIAKLKRCRIPRVVNDRRLHDFVPIEDVPDPSLDRYIALKANGDGLIDTLAEDEDTAKRQLVIGFAEHIAGKNGYMISEDTMIDWIQRGKPVRNTNAGTWPESAPDIRPEEELIELD